MRRVAFVSYHTSPAALPGVGDAGGLNVYLRDLALTLADRGVASDIYTRKTGNTPDRLLSDGVRLIHVPAGPPRPLDKHEAMEHLSEFTDTLVGHAQAGDYDLIHSHYWLSGLAGFEAAERVDVPSVHTAHSLALADAAHGNSERSSCERFLAGTATRLIANTTHEAQTLTHRYGASPERVVIIPPGVDHSLFRLPQAVERDHARQSLGAAPDELLAIFVGRIQQLKGADLAVKAILRLSREAPSLAKRVKLLVVGGASGADGGSTLSEMQRLASDPAMLASVEFVPPTLHHDLARYYHAADVCLVPSRSESFGLVALEAQACGVPVIASAVDGLVHVVRHEQGGLLVPPQSGVGGFSRALQDVLTDSKLRCRLAVGGQANAAQYEWDLTADRHMRVYEDILAARPVEDLVNDPRLLESR